jgi:hypothetical protein
MNSTKQAFNDNIITIDGHYSVFGKYVLDDLKYLSSKLKNPYHKLYVFTDKKDNIPVNNVVVKNSIFEYIDNIDRDLVKGFAFSYINYPKMNASDISRLLDIVFRVTVPNGVIVVENDDHNPENYFDYITNSSKAGIDWFVKNNIGKLEVKNYFNKIILTKY